MSVKKGIDVSYAQGNIDFDKIRKEEVQFAIVRSSFGWEPGQKDSKFDRNVKGFHSRGIPCGAYHYSYAKSAGDAVKEAEYCIQCIGDTRLELPVFLDLEDDSISGCGKRVCTDIIKAFCGRMKKAGFATGVYLNPNWLNNFVYKDEILGKYELWLAQWGSSAPAFSCGIWQYDIGSAGTVSGISGEIDLDRMYTELPSLGAGDKKPTKTQPAVKKPAPEKFYVGEEVKVTDPVNYDNGKRFMVYPGEKYTVIEAVGNRIVIGINGQVTSAIDAKYLEKAGTAQSGKPSSGKSKKPSGSAAGKKKTVTTYTIQPGDTLTYIAKKYHTTVEQIAKENNIRNPDLIYAGDKLRITVAGTD